MSNIDPLESVKRFLKIHHKLLEVAESDEKLASGRQRSFDQGTWGEKKGDLAVLEVITKVHICRTAACLGGWATAVIPELILDCGGLLNTRTDTRGHFAFADALGISGGLAMRLTLGSARHNTARKAAERMLFEAERIAEKHDIKIS